MNLTPHLFVLFVFGLNQNEEIKLKDVIWSCIELQTHFFFFSILLISEWLWKKHQDLKLMKLWNGIWSANLLTYCEKEEQMDKEEAE